MSSLEQDSLRTAGLYVVRRGTVRGILHGGRRRVALYHAGPWGAVRRAHRLLDAAQLETVRAASDAVLLVIPHRPCAPFWNATPTEGNAADPHPVRRARTGTPEATARTA